MNLWTVGCADARLTAQARSPMDKPGEAMRFPHLAHKSAAVHKLHSATTAARIEFGPGKGATFSRLPALAYSSRNLSKRPGPPQSPVGRAKVPAKDGYVRSIARAPAVFRKDITSPVFRQRRRAENPRTTT